MPSMLEFSPWLVFLAYCLATWLSTPRRVAPSQFFDGRSDAGREPSVWLVAFSAAITWIFAKSIANAADLGFAFGLTGSIGYTIYYLSFVVAGVTIYLMRTRGGWTSVPHMLVSRYGVVCARIFMATIAFRLFNEVWSNTKVMALFFGLEGSASYWVAVVLITLFTLSYAWSGGMRASLLTDRLQTIASFILLGALLAILAPPLVARGMAPVAAETSDAGLTFCALALAQILSYPFHDPVLTDRGFLNAPRKMLWSFLLAAIMSGGFIFLFSIVGVYARAFGLSGNPTLSVPASMGFGMMLLFNGVMLLSGGSTIDSAFTSVAKLAAREELASRAHLARGERLQHGERLGPPGGDKQAALHDLDSRLRGDLRPHVARAHRAAPAIARLLTGDGDEAEVADRGAVGLRVAVDHHHFLAAPRRGERMGEAADSGPDDGEIVTHDPFSHPPHATAL